MEKSVEIVLGKTYKVEPAVKKSAYESETFSDGNGRYVVISETWRWGTYYLTPKTEEEVEWMVEARDNDSPLCLTDFEESEMDSTWDGCGTDLEFYGDGWTEDEKVKFEEEYFERGFEVTEEWKLYPDDFEMTFYNGILLEEVN